MLWALYYKAQLWLDDPQAKTEDAWKNCPKELESEKVKEVPRLNVLSSSNFVIQNLKANANLRNDPAEFWFYPR